MRNDVRAIENHETIIVVISRIPRVPFAADFAPLGARKFWKVHIPINSRVHFG